MGLGMLMTVVDDYTWKLTWDHPVFAAVLLDEKDPEPEPEGRRGSTVTDSYAYTDPYTGGGTDAGTGRRTGRGTFGK